MKVCDLEAVCRQARDDVGEAADEDGKQMGGQLTETESLYFICSMLLFLGCRGCGKRTEG